MKLNSKTSKMSKTNKKSKTNYYNQKGITLIALVITIVVLLILAGVSINAIFSENGIIKKAQDAQNKMDQATQNDLDAIDDLSNWIDSKTNGTTGGNTGKDDDKPFGGEKYDKAEKNNDGTLKANTEYIDSENATVTIPKGFKVSNVAATESTEGEQTVSKGLVIQDAEGNEFVWIPVNYTETGTLDSDGLDSGFKEVFKRRYTTGSSYTEPYENGYGENGAEEKEDYIKMMKSVQANKGFYIGRYEAGTTEPRTSLTRTDSNEVVVKRDAYPYNAVSWGNAMNDIETKIGSYGNGAVYLSKHMYDSKDIGATSTLCYGVQWDAIMIFVRSSTSSIVNSTRWGNYKNNAWTIDRATASYSEDQGKSYTPVGSNAKSKTNSESILLTTGASDSFKAKNIFDLAGNVWEWTMEAYDSTGRVMRGNSYETSKDSTATYCINHEPGSNHYSAGFRPALYL